MFEIIQDPEHRTVEFHIDGRPSPLPVTPGSPGTRLLQRIRDEAHRFAVTHHRKLRRKAMEHSVLDEIPGVGSRRKKILLTWFGNVDKIKQADIDLLSSLPAMNRRVAEKIVAFFQSCSGRDSG